MIIKQNNAKKLEFRELSSSLINGITSEFLETAEIAISKSMQDLSHILRLLNIEFNSNAIFSNNHYLLLIRDNEIIGYVILSDVVQGAEAVIKFQFIDNYIDDDEIQQILKETIERVFDRFQLNRLVFRIYRNTGDKQSETRILEIYQAFPIGFLHADDNIAEFVIRNNRFSPEEDFYNL